MKVRFILTLNALIVRGKRFERVIIDFEEETTPDRVQALLERWESPIPFFIPRMEGLYEVGKSYLIIESVETEVFR